MKPLEQFEINVAAAADYLRMYKELRQLKGLGARGRLDSSNQYLLWLPRAAIVTSLGSLDAYVHQVLFLRLPEVLKAPGKQLPEQLCERVSQVLPIKNATHVRDAIEVLQSPGSTDVIADRLREKQLRFMSFQSPDKVIEAYALIGIEDVFHEVARLWSGPNSSESDIRRRLVNYVNRRNQIAHEGDLTSSHDPRPIQPRYANECKEFVESLVQRLDQVTFNGPQSAEGDNGNPEA
jgi:hypothetical protein